MGLYALTAAAVQGLSRTFFGTKIVDGETQELRDTGVQLLVDELRFRLSDRSPIQMPGTLEMVAPSNGPAIRIYGGNSVGGIEIVNVVNNNTTVINPPPSSGGSGTIQVLTDIDISLEVSTNVSACTATVTITPTITRTYQTIEVS